MDVAQLPMRREERKRASAGCARDGGDELFHGVVEHLVLGQRHIGRQAHERLVIEVEWRRQDHLFDLGTQADPGAEVVERAADGQRGRGEDGRALLRVDAVPQKGADVDRGRAQQQVFSPRNLAEPVHAVRVRPEQRFFEHSQGRLEPAADHLQLADALVGLIATQPLAHAGDCPAQRRI